MRLNEASLKYFVRFEKKNEKDVENMIFRFFYRCILRTGNQIGGCRGNEEWK